MKTAQLNAALIMTFIFALTFFRQSSGQESIFPKGNLAPNVHHTGDIWLSHLSDADETFDFNVAQAVSAAGSWLNWHMHPKGQQLLITHGVGYYQEKGKKVKVVRAGDIIICAPNIAHWHGAAPNSPVTYIAISGNAPTEWTDELTNEAYNNSPAPVLDDSKAAEKIKALSKQKWDLMAAKDVEQLASVFHPKAQFVHMGGSWGTKRELEIIKSGGIWYKKTDIHEVSVDVIGDTAILLNRITLLAQVGGNEVVNPFVVTEIYKKENGEWKLANLSFVRQLTPEQ